MEERFPGIKIYFESSGDGIWETNDKEGFFANRYFAYTEGRGEDYFQTLEELIEEVELVTGASGIKTFQECAKALCAYYDEEYGEGVVFYDNFYLGEFDLVD